MVLIKYSSILTLHASTKANISFHGCEPYECAPRDKHANKTCRTMQSCMQQSGESQGAGGGIED
ncbi:hypothetical protein BaRGS_00019358, partial [Batillaria attramentaria]